MDILEFFNRKDNKYIDLFENVLHDEIFNSDQQKVDHAEKTIITVINTKLEHAATHCQGLNLLSNFLFKISKENLTKYFPHWISKITHILSNSQSNSQELLTVCTTIGAIITSCKQVAELDKRISIYIVKQMISVINERYSQDKSEALLNLLTILLYHYSESCARFLVSINSIISSCIDEEKRHLVISGAKCYSLLVRAMERSFLQLSKNNSIIAFDNSAASCHIFYQIDLCSNLYTIMNELFQDLIIADLELPYDLKNIVNIHILQLPKISCDDILEYYTAMEKRFTNICTYLSTLLKVGTIEKKMIALPNVILQIICQGLSITPTNLNKNEDGNRKDLLLLILPKLHTALLGILEALIISFQQELLSYSLIIQRLILQILEWTQELEQNSYKDVRILVYKILSTWITQTKSLSGFQMISDEFLVHILKDVSPPTKNILVLTTKAKKAKLNLNSEKIRENKNLVNCSTDSNVINHTESILCTQVILTVQSIISNVNYFLKQSFYDEIQNIVVLLLYEQYAKKSSISVNKINIEYRLQLLRTLRILETYAHNLRPSSTSYAIQIFGIAISQDCEPEVIKEASLGLAEIRYIVNPTAPSLMLPPSNS